MTFANGGRPVYTCSSMELLAQRRVSEGETCTAGFYHVLVLIEDVQRFYNAHVRYQALPYTLCPSEVAFDRGDLQSGGVYGVFVPWELVSPSVLVHTDVVSWQSFKVSHAS